MIFKLNEEEELKLAMWLEELEPKIKDKYTGAIGGSLTYSFTPTSIGCVVKVEEVITREVIDLTDYENW